MDLGFIGTGAIVEAMVTGLLQAPSPDLSVLLSPRNAETAARLAERFPEQVRIAASNQAVVDGSMLVVLAVRPQIAADVLPALQFRADHHVLSLIATVSAEKIADMVAPATKITRAVPLPSMALGAGPTIVIPPDAVVTGLFGRAGVAIEVADEHAYAALTASSAIMAAHFAAAQTIVDWLSGQGIPAEDGRRYIGQVFSGLAKTADLHAEMSFGALSVDHKTVGGINEQIEANLAEAGAYKALTAALDGVYARLRGVKLASNDA